MILITISNESLYMTFLLRGLFKKDLRRNFFCSSKLPPREWPYNRMCVTLPHTTTRKSVLSHACAHYNYFSSTPLFTDAYHICNGCHVRATSSTEVLFATGKPFREAYEMPDLAPCAFFLFPQLEKKLCGRRFQPGIS